MQGGVFKNVKEVFPSSFKHPDELVNNIFSSLSFSKLIFERSIDIFVDIKLIQPFTVMFVESDKIILTFEKIRSSYTVRRDLSARTIEPLEIINDP